MQSVNVGPEPLHWPTGRDDRFCAQTEGTAGIEIQPSREVKPMPSEIYMLSFLSVLASLVLVIASLYWAKAVLIPLALALMLTFLLQPIVAVLHREARPHASSSAGRYAARARTRTVGWAVVMQFSSLASELPGYQDNLKRKIDDLQSVSKGGVLEKIQETMAALTKEFENNQPPTTASQEAVAVQTQGSRSSRTCPHSSDFWRIPAWCWCCSCSCSLPTETCVIACSVSLRPLDGHHESPRRSRAAHQPLISDAGDRQWHVRVRRGPRAVLLGLPMPCCGAFSAALRFIPYVGPAVGALLPLPSAWRYLPGG